MHASVLFAVTELYFKKWQQICDIIEALSVMKVLLFSWDCMCVYVWKSIVCCLMYKVWNVRIGLLCLFFVSKTVCRYNVLDIKRVLFVSTTSVLNGCCSDKCLACYRRNRTPKGLSDDERPETCGKNSANTLGRLRCVQNDWPRSEAVVNFRLLSGQGCLAEKFSVT